MKLKIMKKHLLLLLGISLLTFHPALAQDSNAKIVPVIKENNSQPRFDLDFRGGIPRALVEAIQRAMGKPLNVIIPDDCEGLRIPAVSVKNVTVAQLFEAITSASKDTRRYTTSSFGPSFGPGRGENWSTMTLTYGFRTDGAPNENSIWYFYQDKLPDTPSHAVCRFYQLSPYLDAGYKVEDITTAIETAWKMLGIAQGPEMKYHKDTKLLIAVGEADELQMIDEALGQLSRGSPKQKLSNGQDSEKSRPH
jgi:hypothetical protein